MSAVTLLSTLSAVTSAVTLLSALPEEVTLWMREWCKPAPTGVTRAPLCGPRAETDELPE
jgi:hypothetical protein